VIALAVLCGLACTAPAQQPRTHLVGISMPSRVATVAPEQAGKIVEMPLQEGDPVEAGAVLFRLNSTLEQLEVERLGALAESDVFTRRAAASLEYARLQAERMRSLREREINSERDMQAQAHELELARLRVEQARLEMAQAKNELAQAKERLAQRTVRSPFDGIVTQRLKSAGEAVEKFAPVIEVMTLDPLWIEFECPFTEQHRFVKGEQITVAPAVVPDDVRTGTILLASKKANASSHTFTVRASVPNADLRWKTGLKVTIGPPPDGDTPSRPGK
jgi:RND family efflux transporter MFP subunit